MAHPERFQPGPGCHFRLVARQHRQTGFTLIELLVTMLIGLLLVLAILVVQTNLSRANMQLADAGQRNDQARVALNLVQRDLGNALYMVGGGNTQCTATLQYTAGIPVRALGAVTAVEQGPATLLPTTPTDPLLSPGTYDPGKGGVSNTSNMVSITIVPSALRAPPTAASPTAPYKVVHNIVSTAVTGQQAVDNGVLPLNNTDAIAVGDAVMLMLPMTGTTSGLACLRFVLDPANPPVDLNLGAGTVPTVQMPAPGKFADFTALLQKAGLLASGQVLVNSQLVGAKLKNEGPATGSGAMQTIVYYVATMDSGAGSGKLPVLVRATLNADGSLDGQPVPVAAGVVSLQVRFGVDGAAEGDVPTGSVTNYLTGDQVETAKVAGHVRTVLYAIVSRTVQTNPNATPLSADTAGPNARKDALVTAVAIPSPSFAAGDEPFAPFLPRSDEEKRNRYTVHTAEVALRNQLWSH